MPLTNKVHMQTFGRNSLLLPSTPFLFSFNKLAVADASQMQLSSPSHDCLARKCL
jgi:hypothetical protein